jgi:hypothetical protein
MSVDAREEAVRQVYAAFVRKDLPAILALLRHGVRDIPLGTDGS